MSNLVFLPEAWADYIYWQGQDKKTLRKINQLLQDISRDNFGGIGKPEPLKEDMAGWWSRHIRQYVEEPKQAQRSRHA